MKIRNECPVKSRIVLSAALLLIAGCGGNERYDNSHSANTDEHRHRGVTREERGATANPGNFTPMIETYVREKSKDGRFQLLDNTTNQTLELVLVRVKEEEIRRIDAERYEVCAIFMEENGKIYDVDFFVQSEDRRITHLVIHSVDGEPRYQWYRDGKIWKYREKT